MSSGPNEHSRIRVVGPPPSHGKLNVAAAAIAGAMAVIGGRNDAGPEAETPAPNARVKGSPRPRPGERPTTMPRTATGQHINPARHTKNQIEAAFLASRGRPMNPKDWKEHKRKARTRIPLRQDTEAMIVPRHGA
jgi:hypothetical protein